MTTPSDLLTVTSIKDYVHCPRFPYYAGCLPQVRPRTYLMDAGKEEHERERERARRRTLRAYGLPPGERHFAVRVESARLGLVGVIDELVMAAGVHRRSYLRQRAAQNVIDELVMAAGVHLPVDYKLSDKANESFEMQVVAYALLVEERYAVEVTQGYIYLMVTRKLHAVAVTEARRAAVGAMVTAIRTMQAREAMPPPVRARAKCRACEFRRFCNDV